jgi:hypothetical protein
MFNRIVFAVIITFSLSACTAPTKKTPEVKSAKGIETYLGNYVDGAYQKRSEGYDWVSVSIVQRTDTSVHVAVRSRADKKKPTCTFDADAVLAKPDTLKAMFEGKAILFTFKGDSLAISTQNKEDEGLLNYFCSGGGSIAATYTKIAEPIDTTQVDKTIFRKALSWNSFFFDVSLTSKKLNIQPVGLEKDNRKVEHEIEGTVVNAEIGDLNLDTFPEVLVYITSDGSGSYGSVIGYSVNNGKSMSMINLPNIADNPKANLGYMGHDEFAIVESTFNQRFPIYKPGDTNAKPTGGMRQIQYKLKDGENMRQFVVDKILEY